VFRAPPADPTRADFRAELTLFADSVFGKTGVVDLRGNADVSSRRIALHYGITDVRNDRFRRVELGHRRSGGCSARRRAWPPQTRTSPVLRGAFILKHIQGVPGDTTARRADAGQKDIGTTKALRSADDREASIRPDLCVLSRSWIARSGARASMPPACGRSGSLCRSNRCVRRNCRRTAINGPDDLRAALRAA
jgi:hypothetical protein